MSQTLLDLEAIPDDDTLYAAFLKRDAAYDGRAFVAVKTTGIFCRFDCPARKPRRENVRFYPNAADCLADGYRPCKRCRPMSSTSVHPLVSELMEQLTAEPTRRWSADDLTQVGYDPSTVRRHFKKAFGVTFLELARLHRLREGAASLQAGGKVIDAQLEAGFESASAFRKAFSALIGRPPQAMAEKTGLVADFISTPIGPMISVCTSDMVYLLEFADRKELPRELQSVEKETGERISFGASPAFSQLKKELTDYFAGTNLAFSVATQGYGTAFMAKVHKALKSIPPGETRSYAALALSIDRPTAMRAVARANAANRLAIIVPCHRVIAADGSLAGYAGGVWRKEWLLNHERQVCSNEQDTAL